MGIKPGPKRIAKSTGNKPSTPKTALKENKQRTFSRSAKDGKINVPSKQVRGTGPRDNYK